MTILRSGQLRFARLPRRVGLAPFDLVETQKIGLNRLQTRNLVLSDAARQLRAPFQTRRAGVQPPRSGPPSCHPPRLGYLDTRQEFH